MADKLELDDDVRRRLTATGRPDGSAVLTVSSLHTWARSIVLTREQVAELGAWCERLAGRSDAGGETSRSG